MEDNSKGFYRCIRSKRKTGEKTGLLLNWGGALVTKDMEMAKLLGAFFTLVFTGSTCLQQSQGPDTRGKVWEATKTYLW